ncbi:MAG: hypothetical protein B7Y39_18795 [Bdellovibrio sp. 28-41-41]|nr:MAG: hypothetical protein B7Y39_18795 [Bdellovibrio sp. 28-41-41]
MKSLLYFCAVFIFFCSSLSAQEVSPRLRPSYKSTYSSCVSDFGRFRSDLLYSTYISSVFSTLSVAFFDGREFQSLVNTRGLGKKLYFMLRSETFILALNDCVPSELVRNDLVAKMLVVDSVGKIVGLSLGGLSYVGVAKVFATLGPTLHKISPILFRRIFIGSTIIGSAFALWKLKQMYFEEDLPVLPKPITELDWKSDFRSKGAEQLKLIDQALNMPSVTPEEIEKLNSQKMEWETALKKVGA